MVPERKSTRAIVPLPATAFAVRRTEELIPIEAPLVGAVSVTVGSAVTAETVTALEVIAAPFESVTRAVRETLPAVVGVHVTE